MPRPNFDEARPHDEQPVEDAARLDALLDATDDLFAKALMKLALCILVSFVLRLWFLNWRRGAQPSRSVREISEGAGSDEASNVLPDIFADPACVGPYRELDGQDLALKAGHRETVSDKRYAVT
ncbi:hypothetical protein AALT_g11960 [Alternaria alternata]|nr:hypothetical protein AALT_g11960 [Alternaria alternata]